MKAELSSAFSSWRKGEKTEGRKPARITGDTYSTGSEHIADELLKLDSLLYRQVLRSSLLQEDGKKGQLDNLFITGEEAQRIVAPPSTKGENDPGKTEPRIQSVSRQVKNIREKINQKAAKSLEKGINLPLYRLTYLFHLTPLEQDILLICLAPELDNKYERIYAYLQDDVSRKYPTINLMLNLLCSSEEERTRARMFFTRQSRLFKYHLVGFSDDPSPKPLLSRTLKIDDSIANFLLDVNMLDARLAGFTKIINPTRDFSMLVMEEQEKERLQRLGDRIRNQQENRRLLFYFQGPWGAGKRLTAEALCHQLEMNLLEVDIPQLKNTETNWDEIITLLFRETLLYPSAIYLQGFDTLIPGEDRQDRERLEHYQAIVLAAVESFAATAFLSGETPWNPPGSLQIHSFVKAEFPIPPYPQRRQLWETSLNGGSPVSPEVDRDLLANTFKFTGGQIKDATANARTNAVMRTKTNETENGGPVPITMTDLYAGCRSQSNRKLTQVAQKVKPRYTWEDIVLPPDKLNQLQEMYNYIRYKFLVYYQWGFDTKFSLGKGLNALFAGSSGTGKTMASEIIANQLNMDLYKIDLSAVVSKYIGETEKNLNKIFKEAETANGILLFDEADALFGKRSEVRDAHDRYANIETNYLLQKMEEHEGIAILTTNFRKNIDDAFTRRFHFVVDFPFPDQEYRLKIWRQIFPAQTPRSSDLDFGFLAKKFKISGGNIKNIALHTAFLAAADSQQVCMEHIILAIKREYQKMGNLCDKSEFGKYYEIVK